MQTDDWRLFGQEKYLLGVELYFKKYSERKNPAEHDHSHCDFCTEKFSDDIPNALLQGYTTQDENEWICEKCFADFKDKFKWVIKMR